MNVNDEIEQAFRQGYLAAEKVQRQLKRIEGEKNDKP